MMAYLHRNWIYHREHARSAGVFIGTTRQLTLLAARGLARVYGTRTVHTVSWRGGHILQRSTRPRHRHTEKNASVPYVRFSRPSRNLVPAYEFTVPKNREIRGNLQHKDFLGAAFKSV
ncbi:hypothetical protein Y032_0442g1535 [Ancylostoma ceylanicum]|nr:hypothetical protein Y032_0442g1535 [Ancylostoma ceylanicum]